MRDVEFFSFLAIFRELLRIFPKRLEESEITPLAQAYGAALQRFSLAQIQAGADTWIQRGKFFPKPAEWRECIPRDTPAVTATVDELTHEAAAEYLDAETRHYEGDPCLCAACRRAWVNHRPLRYVPECDAEQKDIRAKIGTRIITRGHWAHGEELAEFYDARDRFMNGFRVLLGKAAMPTADVDDSMAANPEDCA